MWWDQMFNWPTWVAVSLMTTLALGGLAWLIVLALREVFRPRLIDPTEYQKRVSALTEVRDA